MPSPFQSRRARWAAAAILGLPILLLVYHELRRPGLPPDLAQAGSDRHVRILRDTWGVPHIFGRTDADVAFGLAWAHAEDDFATIQGALLAARGRLASVYGQDAAANDYMVSLMRVWDAVDAGYERDLAPQTRALCEAYAAGLNRYAARHPAEARAALYPVTGRDVVAGFVHKLPLFFGLDGVLEQLFEPRRRPLGAPPAPGSNAFAVAPSRSEDGFTRLAVNSHQPWEGPVAWYEVHLHSDEGWDAAGGTFPGAPLVLHGHNRDLGWAHTVNRPDLIDVYVLDVDPRNPNRYRFDGEWREMEMRRHPIEVKLPGPFSWTFHRATLWSVHGPVVRQPHGSYAIRVAGRGELRQVEQWYRMNRARSLAEWMDAMALGALPMFNTVYADRAGHIAYVYNATLPVRAEGFDWSQYVPGDTSRTLWTEYLPVDRLPRVVDPPSGFVQSCNGTPFWTTDGAGNPDGAAFSRTLGIETRLTNRGLRALELFGGDPSISREEFEAYKFDTAYSTTSATAARLRQLLAAPPPRDPLTLEALEVLKGWDLRTDAANPRAALALLALRPDDGNDPSPVATETLQSRLREAAGELKQRFGRLDPPWQDVNRLRRGATDLGLGGGPDVLRAVYGRKAADGRVVGIAGDSYVLLAEWDEQGRVASRSVNPYGSAVGDARSPHYADQAPLFAAGRLKPVWLDESALRAHLEREYSPD
jgi:penicillin amidase/acyl-homoserine-lactone acylase